MKIVHITKGDKGGLDNICKSIFNAVKKKYEQKVLFFCPEGSKIYDKFENKFVSSTNFKEEVVFADLWRYLPDLRKAKIIHVHHTKAWILFSPLLLFKKKLIYSFHGNFGAEVKKSFFEKMLISLIVNYSSIFSKKLVFLTKGQRDNIKNYSWFRKTLHKKSVIINNFIDKAKIIKKKKLPSSDVVFVGRYTKIKGFDDLIKVARELPDIKFSLIGDKKFKTKLKNVKNVGFVDNSMIANQYDKHSIFILPSYTEAFPMTILEAMARGLVILVSDIPGIKEIVKEKRNGYLFKPGDVKKIKKLISYLKDNPREFKKISQNNLEDIERFTTKKQIPKYLIVYKEMVGNAKK
jgi:glycosyltransferase involved in cell wall biosynthesis